MNFLQKLHFLSPCPAYQSKGFPEDKLYQFTDGRPSQNLKETCSPLSDLLKGKMRFFFFLSHVWKINKDNRLLSRRQHTPRGPPSPPAPMLSKGPATEKRAEREGSRAVPHGRYQGGRNQRLHLLTAHAACKAGDVIYSRRPKGLLSNKDGKHLSIPLRAAHNAASYEKLVISPRVNKIE